MAQSRQSTDNAQKMLRDLIAAERLAASLAETAPLAIAKAGGAQKLVAQPWHSDWCLVLEVSANA